MAGTSYRLRACRIGVVEVDLLSGWLRSRGRLPCVGVVVGGLEFRVETLLSGSCDDDDGGGGGSGGQSNEGESPHERFDSSGDGSEADLCPE